MKMKTVKVSKKSLMTKMSMRRSSQPCKLYCHHNINKPKHCISIKGIITKTRRIKNIMLILSK